MQIQVLSYVDNNTDSIKNAFNVLQVPVINEIYTYDEFGYVFNMSARVENNVDKGWLWFPLESSLLSYRLNAEPLSLTVNVI